MNISDYLRDRDRRLAERHATRPIPIRATPKGRADARHLAAHGPWVRACDNEIAAETAAIDAETAVLIDVAGNIGRLTGHYAPLTTAQEAAILTLNIQLGLDPDEQLMDAALGAVDVPVEALHPRWRTLAA